MNLEWTKELSTSKPLQFERLNQNDWIQRRNIERALPREDEIEAGWQCESRVISNAAYENAVAVESVSSDLGANETIIMEAIADLYEAIMQ